MRREDVRIDTQGETVVVSGQRPGQTCCPERYQQLERGQGHFSRSFRFALPISSDDVVAELVLGVLTVSIPKRQPAGVRIDVT
jgi:HSP20 family molecular chaperone IbpA